MKKLLLSVIAVAAFATTKAQVVFQSDFETGVGSADGWMGTKSYTPSIAASYSAAAYHGSLSAQCTNTSTTSHKRYTTQPLSITANAQYKINFYAQGNGKVRTAIYKGGNSYGTYNSYITVSSSSWTQYSQTVTSDTTSSTAEFIFSVLGTTTPNHLLIDSVTITMTGTVAPQPFLAISAVQTPTGSTDASPYTGQTIKTGGIVTAIVTNTASTAIGFYIENSNAGPYSGIYAYSTTYAPTVVLGDSVNFSANVTEYFGMTELQTLNSFVKHSSGHPLPTPIAVSPISNPGVEQEMYESVLVSISNVTCTAAPNTYGDWKVKDNSTYAITVAADIYTYTPTVGNIYNIKGVMSASTPTTGTITYWSLTPRFAADITGSTIGVNELSKNENVSVYPNPANTTITVGIKNNEAVKSVIITDVLGRTVYTSKENNTTVDVSRFEGGVYNIFVSTEAKTYQTKFVVNK
ncbi:MAG: T9SS type A sorting domain-containing protein [Bacteroidetes bacterium]|nr:T9SS type A sorting domain-containing protein [Bacteroidota bacterium]